MKKVFLFLVAMLVGGVFPTLIACSDGNSVAPNFDWGETEENNQESVKPSKIYDWEKNRKEVLQSTDMVLCYSGAPNRAVWNKDLMSNYIVYKDKQNKKHWLFDSFLFLEILDINNIKAYTKGFDKEFESANKADWEGLLDTYFSFSSGIAGLDQCVAEQQAELGVPSYKRQVVISIPEPMVNKFSAISSTTTKYWGKLDGKELDFSKAEDRVKACIWFIDQVRARFDEKNYQNVELAGFYWVAEDATATRNILNSVADYLKELKYSFNWIPYFTSDGHAQWKSLGFTFTYFQPNYYFHNNLDKSRLTEACKKAIEYDMDMEIEFEDNVCKYPEESSKAYRLRDYMEVFKEHGIWKNKRLAYYQNNTALVTLKNSATPEDQELYHDFCQFVISRPVRDSH